MGSDKNTLEKSYYEVTTLYELADNLIADVMNSPEELQEAHFQLINPLVEQLEASTDILTEEFINIADGKDSGPGSASRSRVETAFRKIYAAMDDYGKRASAVHQQAMLSIKEKAQSAVSRLKLHVEKVLGTFLGLLDLSLDRVMQKNELEQLRKRDEKIASILHNNSMSKGKSG
jgi:hypothetical protein